MLTCLKSLLNSIRLATMFKIYITVVDDHSDCLQQMQDLLEVFKVNYEIINLEDTGNGESLKKCYDIAIIGKSDKIFFLEDDYLLHPNTITEILMDHSNFSKKLPDVALVPYDYPDNYIRPEFMNIPSHIVLGVQRHWRTITNSTCTFLCNRSLISKYWELFELLTHYGEYGIGEDETINKIWTSGSVFLLAPLPSLAVHLHKHTISPYIDWENIWNLNHI
jgi:hypothetical protein